MKPELMEGNGLLGGSSPSDLTPPRTSPNGRRQSDIEAIVKMHSLATQMAVVETQLEHLGERLEETQRGLKEDIDSVKADIDKVDIRVGRIVNEVKRLIDEHTADERVSNEAKFAKLNENIDLMTRKADARHQSLKEIAEAQRETAELLGMIKGGAIRVGMFVIVGVFTFTVSSIAYIITHLDTINRIVNNLTKVP